MDDVLRLESAMELAGYLGVGLLAYSAGYTRAVIQENTSIIEAGLATTRVLFSVSGIPVGIGVMAFLGMGLTFGYLLWRIHASNSGISEQSSELS